MPWRHFFLFASWLIFVGASAAHGQGPEKNILRVCADPNNLPYSNRQEQGFENKIATLIAADMQAELEYTWFPQRMGFIRKTLKSWDDEQGRFLCDLVIGVPEGFDISDTTDSYYRSTYALVFKTTGPLAPIHSAAELAGLPQEQKQKLRIGAFAPSPSVDWLTRYGLFEQTTFYQVMTGDPDYYPGKMIEDELIPGNLDAVLIWGPIGGYFASENPAAGLRLVPLVSEPGIRFDYAMSMGVRRRENDWKNRVEKSIADNREEILAILRQYQVPLIEEEDAALKVEDDD